MVGEQEALQALLLAEVRDRVRGRCMFTGGLSIQGGDFVLCADGKKVRVEVPVVKNLRDDAEKVAENLLARL